MGIIANVSGIIIACSMLYTAYPQKLCISCEIKSVSKISVVEKSINKNLNYLKEDIKIPQLLDGNDEKKIKVMNNVINNDIMPKVEDAEKTAREYFGGIGQEKPNFPYEIYSRYTVSKDNDKLISLYDDYYEYLGGAHGMTTRTSYTIDKDKESLLTLKDLFVKGYDYKDIINREIRAEINKNPQNYFDSGSVFKGISENQNFYIEDDNLVIYYQLYDIAPYVFGIPEFKIPLKLFNKNFIYA
ncbi:DUF3298 and DUF4163 domain-containing protein [Clostridium sp.]|uniref:DUF3298 and DUF4163 domain-containing protein n=1 Tax=Clostridium sp. TaxID=1506 RepID=UPI0028500383|nr:DUF3298 and DUF4163 domain-containing protein [Clostridium sp.]MDR3596988.1 DUF3298 and DUF4163 domain-containing protein [Clostridium sp.]